MKSLYHYTTLDGRHSTSTALSPLECTAINFRCQSLYLTAEENIELQHKQVFDLKRNINDEIREKEAVAKTAQELRNKVKATEAEKVDLSRNIQELRQRVSSELILN
mgnify:CR=1 FL=1